MHRLFNLFIPFLFYCFYSTNAIAQTTEEFKIFSQSGQIKSKQEIVRLPIELWNDMILISLKVNGNPAKFLWDNGFTVSGIDESLLNQFQLKRFGTEDNEVKLLDGNNQTTTGQFATAELVEINTIQITDTPFIIFDSKALTMTDDIKLHGVLGSSIINLLNWNFNFDENYVEVSQKKFALSSAHKKLPFQIDTNNLHYMPIAFYGIPTYAQIDFGSNADEIEINSQNAPIFSRAKATKTLGLKTISITGIAPIDTAYTIKDNYSWTLGGHELNQLPRINFGKTNRDLVLGNRIFRNNYNVIIQTTDEPYYALSPRKNPMETYTDKEFGYFVLKMENKLKIVQIIPNDNTVKYDLKLMDEILELNGKKASEYKDNFTLIDLQRDLQKKNQKLQLKLKNGNEITLSIQPGHEFEFKNNQQLWN